MAPRKTQKSLSHGRPPISKPREHMTSQRSRTIIRTHHRLHKQHAAAVKKGDTKLAESIARAIAKDGGLELYQAASKQGQSTDRGGDSSKVLVEWLRYANVIPSAGRNGEGGETDSKTALRCLEVGALSTTNEISKYPGRIEMTRIDLNSQGTGIEKQDFMERPLTSQSDEKFDIISLSLVLNYVPDPVARGEMLKRTKQFLRLPPTTPGAVLPALFLVLPRPCVSNSRYLDEKLLLQIMTNLGFAMTNQKDTPKLGYYLFRHMGVSHGDQVHKRKVRDGPGMNNFCIVLNKDR